ncbi:MAG: formate dehydrogenase subunit gamma [Epsilonproteobacteria bacterium]|nr:formate dehydrogenase subunit gamma [Campylobacterota bacterium]
MDLSASKGGDLLVSSQMIQNILHYQNWGGLFLNLQVHWFRLLFAIILIGVIVVFAIHYLIIGKKVFNENCPSVLVYPLFQRIIHWIAALSFVLIIPTGLIMMFGKYFGGGEFVRISRYIHSIGTVVFIIAFIPLFYIWVREMIISFKIDTKWVFILGGYLKKKHIKVPAGKFNFGQKTWFWMAILGGFVMIVSGAAMYFQDFNIPILYKLKLDQIDLLRIMAVVHNFVGMAILALFITHLYMSLFAIKGSLKSMLTGYKSVHELKYLNSSYYKKLLTKGFISEDKVEDD